MTRTFASLLHQTRFFFLAIILFWPLWQRASRLYWKICCSLHGLFLSPNSIGAVRAHKPWKCGILKSWRWNQPKHPLSLFFSLLLKNGSCSKSNPSLPVHPKMGSERSSITNALASEDAVAEVCFPLKRGCHVSSSQLMRLSLLENKDGIRTIEMILVSTILPDKQQSPCFYSKSTTWVGS